jgi:hypothetical protein
MDGYFETGSQGKKSFMGGDLETSQKVTFDVAKRKTQGGNKKTDYDEDVGDEHDGVSKHSIKTTTGKSALTAVTRKQIKLQKYLQNQDLDQSESAILFNDREVERMFEELITRLGKRVIGIKQEFAGDLCETETIALTSTYFVDFPLVNIRNVLHTIPTFILQNIQIYEGMISILYNHPCYLYQLKTSNILDSNIVVDWILKIFGGKADDDRTINILTSFCITLMKAELQEFKLDQPNLIKMMSGFSKVYDHILSYQTCNMNFLTEIISYLVNDVLLGEFYEEWREGNRATQGNEDNDFQPIGRNEEIDEYLNLDFYVKNKQNIGCEDFQFKVQRSIRFLKRMEAYIDEILSKPDFIYLNKMSKQVRYLNHVIIEEYKLQGRDHRLHSANAAERKGESLVTELFFQRLSAMLINYEKYGIYVPKEKRGILSEKNIMSLAILINKFFSREDVAIEKEFEDINDYIKILSRSTDTVNNIIRGMRNFDHYDVVLDNIARVIEDTYKVQDRYNSKLSVRDLITMQNFFCQYLNNPQIFLQPIENDPLAIIMRYVENSQLDPNEFSYEVLNYKVNLRVNSK